MQTSRRTCLGTAATVGARSFTPPATAPTARAEAPAMNGAGDCSPIHTL